MLDSLIQYDIKLFLSMNKLGSPEFDNIMYFLSNNLIIWGMLFLIPLLGCFKKYRSHIISIFVFAALSIGISDFISSHILKPTIKRPRPCREISIKKEVYIPFNQDTCSGKYGFTSSHASNVFAIAVFFYLLLGKFSKKWLSLFALAFLMCLTRIYLAKHYPLDLIGGGLVGTFSAFLMYFSWKKFLCLRKAQSQS